jgi:hypothetical protein
MNKFKLQAQIATRQGFRPFFLKKKDFMQKSGETHDFFFDDQKKI